MASRKLRSAPGEAATSLKLKTQLGICNRMVGEVKAYELEVVTNEARIQKMRDDDKDPYDIRKQEEVLQESYMMIPDSNRRMEETIEVLVDIVASCEGDATVDKAMLTQANALIDANESA